MKRRGLVIASGKVKRVNRLIREYRLDLPQTVRFFDADIDADEILVLDLRTARVPNRVLNHPRNRDKRTDTEQ